MSFKTKALGLVAATALSLSLASGAMAESTQVELKDTPCAASVTASSPFNFGSAEWDGDSYEGALTTTGYIDVNVTGHPWGYTQCNVPLTVSNLTGYYNGWTISSNQITLVADSSAVSSLAVLTTNTPWTPQVTSSLNLNGVSVPPDVYQGTVTVGTANAS